MSPSNGSPAADSRLPEICGPLPGERSQALAERLGRVESRNVTCLGPPAPIFWQRASGADVWDVDGNRFVDLGAAFGVANVGHGHPRVIEAVERQARELLHGMGDVHPCAVKVELLEALVALFPGGGRARAVLGTSGSDAVEIALETALLASGRPGILAFEGAYHGLALGALDATWRRDFREPFAARLPHATRFARYGDLADVEEQAAAAERAGLAIGGVIVEPLQGRGGERVPPEGFLRSLREMATRRGWLLIADEIYTGFGRTGHWLACAAEDVVPDLLCVGKGLASGLPISACLGSEAAMSAWPRSRGEALRTQTFLGHPLGCAAALASMRAIEQEGLVQRAAALGARALARLRQNLHGLESVREVRGRGLMIGIECRPPALAQSVCEGALSRGVITLPCGERGEVISITPPLCIAEESLYFALDQLVALLRESDQVEPA